MKEESVERLKKRQGRKLLLVLMIVFSSICILILAIPLYQYMRYGEISLPMAAVDCIWDGTGLAWIDSNSNGIFDNYESPLPGVAFHVDDVLNNYQEVNRPSVSNWNGEAALSVWLPGCPGTSFEIHPDVPQGFRLTTGAKLAIDGGFQGKQFAFGFYQIDGFPTVTPRPRPPTCISYPFGTYINALAVSSDGSVWVSVYGKGVSRYIPKDNQWVSYTKNDGLGSNNIRAITAGDNGIMWFGLVDGISKYENETWQSFTFSLTRTHVI